MSADDIVVGSKWIDDAPGGYGEVTVTWVNTVTLAGAIQFTWLGDPRFMPTSAFLRLFRPVVPVPVPDTLAALVAAEEAFLVSRGWRSGTPSPYTEKVWSNGMGWLIRVVAVRRERGE